MFLENNLQYRCLMGYRLMGYLLFVLSFMRGAYGLPSQAPIFFGKISPGSYGVGLREMIVLDKSRDDSTQRTRGRTLHITLWYPVSPAVRIERMSFADYMKLSNAATEGTVNKTDDIRSLRQSLSLVISSQPEGMDSSLLDQILASRMMAMKNVAPSGERFPLVLWSARHGTIAGQSVLCEYLASHGYVVAFVRYHGPAMPAPYEAKTQEIKLNTLKEHVRDLEFALKNLKSLPDVDLGRKTGLISWSYAGESATLLQMQNPEIGLVISLSSNVLSGWVYQGQEELSNLEAARLNVPYIIMTEHTAPNGVVRTPPEILKTLDRESYFISFSELAHGNFNTTEGMIPGVMGISNVPRWSKSGPVAQLGYETISMYTLHFLDTYLDASVKNPDPLKNWDWNKGLPKGFVTITRYGSNLFEERAK